LELRRHAQDCGRYRAGKKVSIQRVTATAVFTAVALGVAAGQAQGAPTPNSLSGKAISRSDHGTRYTITRFDAGITTTLSDGTFVVRNSSVLALSRSGAEIARLPLLVTVGGREVSLRPVLDRAATQLTVRPIDSGSAAGRWVWISPKQEYINTSTEIGGAIGAVGGTLIGLVGLIGFGVLVFVTMPVGALIGWGIGTAVGNRVSVTTTLSEVPRRRWEYRDCENNALTHVDSPAQQPVCITHYEYQY
jgi:hypothetical protein